MIEDMYTKGFVKLSEPEALDIIRIDDFRLPNNEERLRDNTKDDIDPELTHRINLFAQYLRSKYVDPTWPNNIYDRFIVFDAVDKFNQVWHTDICEKYDIFFLYYLDNTYESTGGSIHFRWNKDEEYGFQPKAGDLVLINNVKGFWHKAKASQIKRRVISFHFNI